MPRHSRVARLPWLAIPAAIAIPVAAWLIISPSSPMTRPAARPPAQSAMTPVQPAVSPLQLAIGAEVVVF